MTCDTFEKPEKQVESPYLMLMVLMIGTFSGLFGETALNMALPTLMDEFSITAGIAQWLVTGYLLTLAIFMPVSAILTKWFNTRSLILNAILISFIGCVIATVATSIITLMIGRIVHAIGTAIILPVLINAALVTFPKIKHAAIMGFVGIAITLAPAIGPTLSGVIITFVNWRAIFIISALLYMMIFMMTLSVVENIGDISKPEVDVISIALSALGFGGVVFSLSIMAETPLLSPTLWLSMMLGITSLILFAWRQGRITLPMINFRVFNQREFSIGLFMMMLSIMSVLATAIVLPIYFMNVLKLEAALAGMFLLPGNIANVVLSPIVGNLYHRYDTRVFTVMGAVFILLSAAIFLGVVNESTSAWKISIAFTCLCCGVTCIIMPAQTTALSALSKTLYADGSSVWNTLYQVSGAIGSAVSVTLMSQVTDKLLVSGGDISETAALSQGVHAVFYFILLIGALSLYLAFKLRKPD